MKPYLFFRRRIFLQLLPLFLPSAKGLSLSVLFRNLAKAAVGYSVITVPISRPPWLTATTYPAIFGSKTATSLKRWDTPCAIAQAAGRDAGPFRKTVWPPWSLSSSRAETASRTIWLFCAGVPKDNLSRMPAGVVSAEILYVFIQLSPLALEWEPESRQCLRKARGRLPTPRLLH